MQLLLASAAAAGVEPAALQRRMLRAQPRAAAATQKRAALCHMRRATLLRAPRLLVNIGGP